MIGPFGDLRVGAYGVIYADPAWRYVVRSAKGEGRSAVRHYATMSLAEIKALPVAGLALRDCHLFLWTTGPHLRQAFDVMEAWGFRYSAIAFTWVKLNPRAPTLFFDRRAFHKGLGHTTRKNTEICLLGRLGAPKRLSRDIDELIIAPRRKHSQKPEEARERIERYATGPYVELFARSRRTGWDSWGREVGVLDRVAA